MFLRVSCILFTVSGLFQISIFFIPPVQPENPSLFFSQVTHKLFLCLNTAYISAIYIVGYNCLLISFAILQWN